MRTAGSPRSRTRCRSSGASLRSPLPRSPSRSRAFLLARPSPSLRVHRLSLSTSAWLRRSSHRRCAPDCCHPGRCSDTFRNCHIRPRSQPATQSHRTEHTPSPIGTCRGMRCTACLRCRRRWRLTSRCSGYPGRGRWSSSRRTRRGPCVRTPGTFRPSRSMRREGHQWSRLRAISPSLRKLCICPRSRRRCSMTRIR